MGWRVPRRAEPATQNPRNSCRGQKHPEMAERIRGLRDLSETREIDRAATKTAAEIPPVPWVGMNQRTFAFSIALTPRPFAESGDGSPPPNEPSILPLIANVYIIDRFNDKYSKVDCQHVASEGQWSAPRHLAAAIAKSLRGGGTKPATMRSASAAVCRRMSGTATISQKAA